MADALSHPLLSMFATKRRVDPVYYSMLFLHSVNLKLPTRNKATIARFRAPFSCVCGRFGQVVDKIYIDLILCMLTKLIKMISSKFTVSSQKRFTTENLTVHIKEPYFHLVLTKYIKRVLIQHSVFSIQPTVPKFYSQFAIYCCLVTQTLKILQNCLLIWAHFEIWLFRILVCGLDTNGIYSFIAG